MTVRGEERLVTIIVPVYNGKLYLQRCLDSLFAQTHSNIEIIAVNDGSFDGSRRVLQRNADSDPRLRIIDQENSGQGVARNRALREARGEFVLFVDADDFIEPTTVEITVARAVQDDSDLVHFDWKLASRLRHRPKAFNYYNVKGIWKKRMLLGNECDELMDTVSFFSVTSLYRTSFLREKEIWFGEGYIYEDNVFYVLAANRAERVSLHHVPLYVIQPNAGSTTQTAHATDRHAVGHIRAIQESLQAIEIRSPKTLTYFAKYQLQKFMEYSASRVPKKYRAKYSKDFVEAFAPFEIELDPEVHVNRYLKGFVANGTFRKNRQALFHSVVSARNKIAPPVKRKLHDLRQLRALRRQQKASRARKRALRHAPIAEVGRSFDGAFLFLGFDGRYVGNSRALFEQMGSDHRFGQHPRFFVTDDQRVDEAARISPRDTATIRKALGKAAVVFAESWVPLGYPKSPDALWIQLWHGTPFKKVFFDSHEGRIIDTRPDHKVLKHRDIQKWDYLLADSDFAREKFNSAFLFPSERIVQAGYPRVKYLLDNRFNAALKERVKASFDLSQSTKVALYAPTWRDYNYGLPEERRDHSYALECAELAEELGDDWVVLVHDHDYMARPELQAHPRVIHSGAGDIQELLLVADAVISDYSSVIFDSLALGTPIALYCTDQERFEQERGLYEDARHDMTPFFCDTPAAAAKLVLHPPQVLNDTSFLKKYSYNPKVDFLNFLDELDLHRIHRDW